MKLKVGDFVIKVAILGKDGRVESCSSSEGQLGQVVSVSKAYRCKTGQEEDLFRVKRIDTQTGLQMKCPDSRCEGACVICSCTNWEQGYKKLTAEEEALYRREGVLKV